MLDFVANPNGSAKTFTVPSDALAQKPKDPPQEVWIGRILATREGLESEKIDKIAVSAGPTKSKTSRIVTLRIRTDSTAERLITDIDAAVRTSGHRYARVDAFRPGDKVPEFTRNWEVPIDEDGEGEAEDVDNGRDTVSSAHAGLLRQAHSHNDTYLKAFQALVGETLQHHRETNVELRREASELRKENAELSRLLSTREDERAARQIQINREQAIAGAFQNLVTAVSIRLSGKGESISQHLVDLLDGLTEKQQDAIVSLLREDQKPLLESIFKTVYERKAGRT
jgi:hypothetical protein